MRIGMALWSGAVFSVVAVVAGAPARGATQENDADRTRIEAALEKLRAQHEVPALGAAWFTAEKLGGSYVVGERAAGSAVAPGVDDAWHVGSCTKSMTATLLALLVERGDLKWETPLKKLLPDAAPTMDAAYRDLTLVELLAHRAGVPAMTGPDATLNRCAALDVAPIEQRRQFTRAVLALPPVSKPRGDQLYSNAGIVIAGHVAEVAAGKPWEQLMQELLFEPLGMATAGFGAPGFADELDQPRGHGEDGEAIEPGPEADNPPLLGPAGTVHASLADWAKYLQLHLRGVKGDVKVGKITLRAATFAQMRTPYPPTSADRQDRYGFGWVLPTREWATGDKLVMTHTGSNGLWYACCWLDPAGGYGMIAATNRASGQAPMATDGAVVVMLQEYQAAAARAKKE